MADKIVSLILPAGTSWKAQLPAEVQSSELIPQLLSILKLPTVGIDAVPLRYHLESRALGRRLLQTESLDEAGVPRYDRLILTADLTVH